MQQKASKEEAEKKAWQEETAAAEKRRAKASAAQAKVKLRGSQRVPRKKTIRREPLAVSVSQALELIPISKETLYRALRNGSIKSRLAFGKRSIDFQSLKEAFRPLEDPFASAEGEAAAKDVAHAE